MGRVLLLTLATLLRGCCIPFGDNNNCNETRPGSAYDCDVQACQQTGHVASLVCVDPGTPETERDRVQSQAGDLVAACRASCPPAQSCTVTSCVRSNSPCRIPNP